MAIIKSFLKTSTDHCHSQTPSNSSAENEAQLKEYNQNEEELEIDSDSTDDLDVAEVGAELNMIGDQTCSIPYELFDLQDLNQILSLDTWNTCLTDEERYELTAYLPDMDQQTFSLTIKQILGGEAMYFRSPMEELFSSLKGGLCLPDVARYRESLQLLQMKKHHHNVRNYHNKMVNTFSEMQIVWQSYHPRTSIDKKLGVWLESKHNNNHAQLGIQSAFAHTDPAIESAKKSSGKPLFKNDTVIRNRKPQSLTGVLYTHNQEKSSNQTKADGKGVLKVRPPSKISFPIGHSNVKLEPKESLKIEKRTSRGVLKISPLSVRNEKMQRKPVNFPYMESHRKDIQVNPSQHYYSVSRLEDENFEDPSASLRGTNRLTKQDKVRKHKQRVEFPYTEPISGKYEAEYGKKTGKGKELRAYNSQSQFADNHRLSQDSYNGAESDPYLEQPSYDMDFHGQAYCRNSIEHFSDTLDNHANAHLSYTYDPQLTQQRKQDQDPPIKAYGRKKKQEGYGRSKKQCKDTEQSPEDKYRILNKPMILDDDYQHKQGHFDRKSDFAGNQKQAFESNAFMEEQICFEQDKSSKEPKKKKKNNIGSAPLAVDKIYKEPRALEESLVFKHQKRKKDSIKGKQLESFQPQPHQDKQKLKFTFKTSKGL